MNSSFFCAVRDHQRVLLCEAIADWCHWPGVMTMLPAGAWLFSAQENVREGLSFLWPEMRRLTAQQRLSWLLVT